MGNYNEVNKIHARDIFSQHALHPKNESFHRLLEIRKGTFGKN